MRFEFLFVLLLGFLSQQVAGDDEALRECANIHHISIQVIPNVHATFTNHKCLLTCFVDNKTLASDPINEGVACPLDSNGICRNGQCIGGQEAAIGECSKLHSLDFHLVRNSGTQYTNSLCQLKCVIDGNVIGHHGVNEGLQCPKDFNGVCRNGLCVTASETKPTNVPINGPTTAPTTAPTKDANSLPIGVTFIQVRGPKNTTITFHTKLCFQYTGSSPFSWSACDLTWTSRIIHGTTAIQEKCFTIQKHKSDSVIAIQHYHESHVYDDWHMNFEINAFDKSLDQWHHGYSNRGFDLSLGFQKVH